MRILMLSWEYPPKVVGGLSRHVQELSEALVRAGHHVEVITGECAGEAQDALRNGVWVRRVRMGYPGSQDFFLSVLNLNFAMLERAARLASETGPAGNGFDLIHAHDWLAAYAARTLKHAWRKPLVATVHATEWGRNNGLHNELQRRISDVEWWLTYEAWRVIVCSQSMRRELRHIFQLPDDKLEVIPNGISTSGFQWLTEPERREFRARYALPDEKIVLFVGRLVREKGAGVLLESAVKIITYYPRIKFVIAGTGPLLQGLRDRARQLGIDGKVVFTGFVDDQTRNSLYQVADVAAFPSLYEPFGIVALEAMVAGVPVVASDTGGFSEILVHGVNGLKAYTNNSDSLANNVLTLLHSPELCREVADQARKDVSEFYGWQMIASSTARLYSRVCSEHRNSRWAEIGMPAEFECAVSSSYSRPETDERRAVLR